MEGKKNTHLPRMVRVMHDKFWRCCLVFGEIVVYLE
jgi:hypothetical protein